MQICLIDELEIDDILTINERQLSAKSTLLCYFSVMYIIYFIFLFFIALKVGAFNNKTLYREFLE